MRLDDVKGQAECIEYLKSFVAAPYSTALLFQGASGIGKTSAAYALAAELGVDFNAAELGGMHVIASGEQGADQVRETFSRMTTCPMSGSGWKVFIINEVDRMSPQAETIWLDRLEQLPGHTVIVFSTNHPENLTDRFVSRCQVLQFAGNHRDIGVAAIELLKNIWQKESRQPLDQAVLAAIIKKSTALNGDLNLRTAVMKLQQELARPAVQGVAKVATATQVQAVKTLPIAETPKLVTCRACGLAYKASRDACPNCGMETSENVAA
jgi:DNA polymerase III delta prime subunit